MATLATLVLTTVLLITAVLTTGVLTTVVITRGVLTTGVLTAVVFVQWDWPPHSASGSLKRHGRRDPRINSPGEGELILGMMSRRLSSSLSASTRLGHLPRASMSRRVPQPIHQVVAAPPHGGQPCRSNSTTRQIAPCLSTEKYSVHCPPSLSNCPGQEHMPARQGVTGHCRVHMPRGEVGRQRRLTIPHALPPAAGA